MYLRTCKNAKILLVRISITPATPVVQIVFKCVLHNVRDITETPSSLRYIDGLKNIYNGSPKTIINNIINLSLSSTTVNYK